jgi:2-iminobutanoate/2-iminopropanoate deaminase
MKKEVIHPDESSKGSILSPAVKYGNLVFTSGMVGRDPKTGEIGDDIQSQARVTLDNIKAALEAAGSSLDQVLKVTGFLANLDDRPAFNEVYKTYFTTDPPVRTCIQGGRLGDGILVEVDVVAGVE